MAGETDPFSRRCMIWEENKQDRELLSYFKKLNALRKKEKTLVYGEYKDLNSDNNILTYKRVLNGDEIFVILNNNADSNIVSIKDINGRYFDLLEDREVILENKIQLEGNDIKILKYLSE